MARAAIALALATLIILPPAAADARTAQDRYLAGFVDTCGLGSYGSVHALAGFGDDVMDAALELLVGADNGVEPTVPGAVPDAPLLPDGACFPILPGERAASVQLVGDGAQPSAFWYGFTVGSTLVGSAIVCGASGGITVPAGAETLSIVVYPYGACGAQGEPATTGTVTVTFS